MGISVADNFSYLGGKPLDGRIQYATLSVMKAMADATLYEGCEAYCVETDKYYKWKSSNTVDASTGKWREVSSGGQTYNDFTGATSSTAGAHGLVPAPSAGDEGKVLRGDGTWATLVTGYDWSSNSVESDILSLTEKPIGQWTDGKILYQKVVDCGSMPANTVKNVAHGISNLGEVVLLRGVCKYDNGSGYTSYPLPKIHDQDINLDIGLAVDATNIYLQGRGNGFPGYTGFVVLRYTKTTDSPLSADEKFAGVTSSGAIIYKRTWVLNTPLPGSGDSPKYTNIQLTGLSSIPIDLLLKHDIAVKGVGEDNAGKYLDGNSTKLTSTIFPTNSVAEVFQTQTSVTGGFVVKEITLYYTKSS